MKNLFVLFAAITLLTTNCLIVSAQKTQKTKRPVPIGEGHDKISEKLFIDASFFKKFNLDPGTVVSDRIRDWASMEKENKYAVVNDIRWEFDNPEQAIQYQKENLVKNSQKGVELQNKIIIPGVTEIHIYKQAESITSLNNDLGINTMEYGYLFVVDKVVVKVWVKVNGIVTVEEASLFAKEAAKTVRAAGK